MTVESMKCPNCGAALSLKPGQNLVECDYCHTTVRVSGQAAAKPAVAHPAASPKSADGPFRMTVEDVFSIRSRGTVVTGRVESGTLHMRDSLLIQRGSQARKTTVIGIEMFHKVMDHASAGDNVGLLLKDVDKNDVQRGDVLSAG